MSEDIVNRKRISVSVKITRRNNFDVFINNRTGKKTSWKKTLTELFLKIKLVLCGYLIKKLEKYEEIFAHV